MLVMGVSIGTRRHGIAVLNGYDLETAQVHSICGRWSPQKVQSFITIYKRYIHRYRIAVVVLKVPKPSHFTKALKQLIRAIDKYVKQQGCLVEHTTIENIKHTEPSIKNRNTLREYVVARYPDLLIEKQKDIHNKQPYYMKLFEATIVAHIRAFREPNE